MWKVWLKGAIEEELTAKAEWAYTKLTQLFRWLIGGDDAEYLKIADEDVTFIYVCNCGKGWQAQIEWDSNVQKARLISNDDEDDPVWIDWSEPKSFIDQLFLDVYYDELLGDYWWKLLLEQRFPDVYELDKQSIRMLKGEAKIDHGYLTFSMRKFRTSHPMGIAEEKWVMPFRMPERVKLHDVEIADAITNEELEF